MIPPSPLLIKQSGQLEWIESSSSYVSLLLFSQLGEATIAPREVNYTVSDISLRIDGGSVLWYCSASSLLTLTSLWGVGQTSETRASPARRTRQCSASCSAASRHRPMSLCRQRIQLQGAMQQREAKRGDVDRDACAMAKDMSLWWRYTHTHARTSIYTLWCVVRADSMRL